MIQGRYKQILFFSLPVILSQGLQTAAIILDRYILSFKDPLFTSAATTGGFTALSLNMFFIYFLSFSTSLIAKSFGKNDLESCSRTLLQSCLLCVPFSVLCYVLSLMGTTFFLFLQHPVEFSALENDYFKVVMLSYIPFLLKICMESYLLGVGRPRLVFIANLMGFVFNAILCYFLVLGCLDFLFSPLVGAAVATLIANTLTAGFIFCLSSWQWRVRRLFLHMKEYLVQGFYTGLDKFATGFCYVLFINMFVMYGEEVSLAISIVSSWDQITYLPFMGIYSATLSLYSRLLGQNKYEEAGEMFQATLKMTLLLTLGFAVFFISFSPLLIEMFLHKQSSLIEADSIRAIGKKMFFFTSFYIFFQALVVIYKAALRSLGFSSWSFWYTFLINAGLVCLSAMSVYKWNLGPIQVWSYFTFMVALLSFVFVRKYYFSKSVLLRRMPSKNLPTGSI